MTHRRGVPSIDHSGWPLGVVALGDLSKPVGGVARALRDLTHQQPLAEQPEYLATAPLCRFACCAIALFELPGARVR